MENNKLIIIALIAIIIVLGGIIAGTSILKPANDTNNTNNTTNISTNTTNETNETNTTNTTKKTTTKKSTKKSSSSKVESESIKENYQAGDGSKYREVKYKDGNIRQYDSKGRLIGSSYDSDQAQLKRRAGNSWPGD
ncbi:MAG: flagellar protein, FliL [Methanosphaera sp.]|nr:flagellar protein, FliL [Methanosphaera sp.]